MRFPFFCDVAVVVGTYGGGSLTRIFRRQAEKKLRWVGADLSRPGWRRRAEQGSTDEAELNSANLRHAMPSQGRANRTMPCPGWAGPKGASLAK